MSLAFAQEAVMQLSPHFSLAEMTKSAVALRRGVANEPDEAEIAALGRLCAAVLEPVRARFGRPVFVSSGYRSPRVNRLVGGQATSQHCRGEAADIEVPGIANGDVAAWIRDHLRFDQLILEAYTPGRPDSGWVHVSFRADRCRRMCLTWPGSAVGYLSGLRL